jgi:hypothetical protein
MPSQGGESLTLQTEARVFARCLVGRMPPQELIDRYVDANRLLLGEEATGRDAALLAFVRRHPWSASFLDAACGLLAPGGVLRSKILIMAGIVETSPDFADQFLPRVTHPVSLFAQLVGLGTLAALRTGLGAMLYVFAIRSRA